MEDKEKNAYREKMEAQMNILNAKIEEFNARAKKAKAEAKIEYNKNLEDLKMKRDALKSKLQQMKEAGGKAGEELKAGVQKAMDDLKTAVDRAFKRTKEE